MFQPLKLDQSSTRGCGDGVRAAQHIQLGENVVQVPFYSELADEELRAYFLIGQPTSEKAEYVHLLHTKPRRWRIEVVADAAYALHAKLALRCGRDCLVAPMPLPLEGWLFAFRAYFELALNAAV